MGKTVIMFPGQGAQKIGMSQEFYEKYKVSRDCFEKAENVTGLDMTNLIFKENENLDKTEYTQIALYTAEMAAFYAGVEEGLTFDSAIGLSLGEYSAMTACGAIDFVRAFLKEREWSLFFFCVKRFQLCHNRGEQIADFPEIFASDVLQRFLGKVCHFLLCTGTVLQNAVCIGKINLGNKGIHHGFLFVGQNRIIHDLFLFFRLLYRKFRFRLRSAET